MAKENDKGDTKWEGQRVRWGHTKRGNAEGSQGGHRGVLSVKFNPFNGLHLSSIYIYLPAANFAYKRNCTLFFSCIPIFWQPC